ncbi:MAG: tol-pal system protein YbgF [Candidatus Acidiferrales bacterium]
MLTPPPAGAVSKEMIELQQSVDQLAQAQRDMRSTMDTNNATLKTLVQQSLDSINQLNNQMGALQKTVQESAANSGARIDTMTTQTQGLSDNMADVQARVGKLSQQMTDIQGLLQTIDGKISGGGPGTGAGAGSGGGASGGGGGSSGVPPMAPISADTLYQSGLRDFNAGNYDLSKQEFSDYLKNFPTNPLAGNAQFYLGEISYAQDNFADAVTQYDMVLYSYPKSFKLAASLLKKGQAEIKLGQKASGTRDLREVVRRFPGTDEARQAQARLKELGAAPAAHSTTKH